MGIGKDWVPHCLIGNVKAILKSLVPRVFLTHRQPWQSHDISADGPQRRAADVK